MSCWVVPTVAAEMWGVTVEHVLSLIAEGKVPSKRDYHFLVVDVAPDSPQVQGAFKGPGARPATFTPSPSGNVAAVLDIDEIAALSAKYSSDEEGSPIGEQELTPCVRPGELSEVEEPAESSWVRVRQIVGKRRRRPVG